MGPFTLLDESRMNHIGMLGFEWLYCNVIVRGHELPFDHHMSMRGKWS